MINNRYDLHEQLGAGGMGAVYRATDRLTGDTVALKRVTVPTQELRFQSRSADTHHLQLALAREFGTLASMRHPHIIEVLDYGFDAQRQPFFTMSLLQNARTILEAGHGADVETVTRLLLQVLAALAYLHRRGILHRDLKPGNILVDPSGVVRVLDFGLAVEREQARDMAGTVAYMAPEVLSGGRPTPAADLYSVGVIAYELLVGRHPFELSNLMGLMRAVLSDAPDFSDVPLLEDVDLAQTVLLRPRDDRTVVELDASALPPLETAVPELDNPLARILARLLAKNPTDRYQEAAALSADLCAATGLPLPPETADIRESYLQAARFVGRAAELNQLREGLEATLEGLGSAWLVGGESGVGKTRLVNELRVRALVEGALVVRGAAIEGMPYQAWRQPIRRLVLGTDLTDLEAGILAEIVPDIGALLGRDIPPVPPLPGQQRLAQTIADLCRRQTKPVVLVLEDLQWASEGLLPLQQLIAAVADSALMVVGTYRHDERPALPDQLPGMTLLPLQRLDATAIAELSVSMLGEVGQRPDVLQLLHQETEGNVYFLVETVRALAEEAGRLAAIGERDLPQAVMAGGVQAIIRRRLAQLPAWGQPLLRGAALVGRELDLAVIEVMAGDIAVDEWLTTCANAAVLTLQDGRWEFAHDKLRLAVLDALSAEEARAISQMAAYGIERVYPDDVTYAAVLARLWRTAGNQERYFHYVLLAADHFINSGAFREAQHLLEAALPIEDSRRARLLKLLGDALEGQSDYKTARQHYEASLALADDDRSRGEALMGLGHLYVLEGDWEQAEAAFTRSLEHFGALDDQRGQADNQRNLGNVAYFRGNYDQAQQHYRHALERYRAIAHRRGIAGTLGNLGNIDYFQGHYPAAQQAFEQCLELFRELGDRRGTAGSLINLGNIADRRAKPEAAADYYAQSLEAFEAIGDRRGMAIALSNMALIALRLGDVVAAAAQLERSRTIYDQIGNRHGVGICLTALADVALLRADHEEALDYFERARALFDDLGDPRRTADTIYGMGVARLESGQRQAGLAHLDQALATAQEMGLTKLQADVMAEKARVATDPIEARRLLLQGLHLVAETDDWHSITHLMGVAAEVLIDQPRTSALVVGMVLAHPATEGLTRRRSEQLRSRLVAVLGEAAVGGGVEMDVAMLMKALEQGEQTC